LTPTTVLLDQSGEPWLIDLAIPGEPSRDTAVPRARAEADVRTLGDLLAFLVLGRDTSPTADRADQREAVRAALRGAGVSPRLEEACLQALADNPGTGPAGLAADLERSLRPSRVWLWVALTAGAALLLAGGWWLFLT
jgi:hypothetical protein